MRIGRSFIITAILTLGVSAPVLTATVMPMTVSSAVTAQGTHPLPSVLYHV
jgi:hypothetical protein